MNSELLDRMPPASLDSERGVIGSILLDRRCLGDVAEIVAADDFYADANRRLFATLVAMDFERRQIDVTLLLERLRSNGELEAVGGAAYLAEVLHSVPYAVHASQYARIVREKAVLRAVIDASCDSLRDAYAAAAEPQAILDAAEQRLQAIGARRAVKHATAMDLAAEVTHYIEQARQGRGLGMETGFPVFDKKFGGLFGGEFIVLAARPAVGKSALASQIADYNASSGRLTYVVSLEMSGRELALRSVCREAGVNGQTIRAGRLDDEAVTRLTHKINLYSRKNLLVDRGIDMTVEVLARSVRRLMPRGLTLVVVDYLSLLTASDQRQPRHEQVANQSRALKQLARETQLPIVVLCQLNRSAEEDARRPQLRHLKESGAIEQDADMVLFIHRPDEGIMVPDPNGKKGAKVKADWPAEVIVAKHRNGATGTLRLDWDGGLTRFSCHGYQADQYDEFAEFATQQEAF